MNLSENTFLFVVAHPDDEVISCGGLLYDMRKFSKVLLATNRYENENLTLERVRKFKDLMYSLEIEEESLNLEAYKFSHTNTLCIQKIRELSEKVDFVITHHPNDFNHDHSELGKMVTLAVRDLSCSVLFMNSYAPEKISSFRGSFSYKYSSVTGKSKMLNYYDDKRYNKYYVLCRDSMNSTDCKSYIELYEPYRLFYEGTVRTETSSSINKT